MLELAQQLSHKPLHYGVRFVALSAGETDLHGMNDYVERMSTREKKNTLLVIDLNSRIKRRLALTPPLSELLSLFSGKEAV